jgi:hypothetical protein
MTKTVEVGVWLEKVVIWGSAFEECTLSLVPWLCHNRLGNGKVISPVLKRQVDGCTVFITTQEHEFTPLDQN